MPPMRILAATVLAAATTAFGADLHRFSSGPARVSLIELYTSEGCSSCPPADQWLGSLRDRQGLWTSFVPVEFHVNYWDSLGWKDRLSTKAFTSRQYAYASSWGSGNVYTPCFVRDGGEWKPSWGAPGASQVNAGLLAVEIADDGTCTAEFSPAPASRIQGGYKVHIALLGGGIASRVTAGENSGETLNHEFVVLGLSERVLLTPAVGSPMKATLGLPKPSVPDATRRAFAAWVTSEDDQASIQATGGWLP
jgi:hypothetical protein